MKLLLRVLAAPTAMAVAAALGACAAPPLTPERTSALAYQALGPEMQMGEQLTLVWVTAPATAPATATAAGPPPMARELAAFMARAQREPINVGVGGPDSAYTAQVLHQALQAAPDGLRGLRIAFVGRRAEASLLGAVASAKGAVLHFESMDD